MSVVAVIPARGGSKGVVRKNVRPVGGVPLIARAVHSLRRAALVDAVLVSTDDAEIAAVARAAGAEIIDRPDDLAGDTATSESALLHAVDQYEARGTAVSTIVFVQATSPFIDPADVDQAVRMITQDNYDSVFSAFETYGFLWRQTDAGDAAAINHDAATRPRRQDREPHYLETGAFYAFDAAGFRAAGHRFFGRTGIVQVAERSAIEIDDAEQLAIASAIAPLIDTPEPIDVDAVVTDFDGVHTDDTAIIDGSGNEQVRVSRSDGMGVSLLRRAGLSLLILSSEVHPIVRARATKLDVPVLHGILDKASTLRSWAEESGVDLARVAYLGNDLNDLEVMGLVGWPIAVADAKPEVLRAARVVLTRAGGQGAVRELADRVLASRASQADT